MKVILDYPTQHKQPDPENLVNMVTNQDLFKPNFSEITEKIGAASQNLDSAEDSGKICLEDLELSTKSAKEDGPDAVDPIKVLDKLVSHCGDVDIFYVKKAIGRPKNYLAANHVKKDALWKPLFRKFRRFLKDFVG